MKRITFLLRNPGYFRNIEWIVEDLSKSKLCDVRVVIGGIKNQGRIKRTLNGNREKMKTRGDDRKIAFNELQDRFPEVLFTTSYFDGGLSLYERTIKILVDNLFFWQESTKSNAPARNRLGIRMTSHQISLLENRSDKTIRELLMIGESRLLEKLKSGRALIRMKKYIASLNTELICVIPCVGDEIALLIGQASKELKIPAVGLVASWDNLTIKGKFLNVFSKVICWSNFQIEELATLHNYHVPEHDIVAVGAYPFAHRSSINGPVLPFGHNKVRITWLMSSGFIGGAVLGDKDFSEELKLIHEFIAFLSRLSHEERRSLFITFRLHPQNVSDPEFEIYFRKLKVSYGIDFQVDFSGEPIGEYKRKAYTQLLQQTDVCVGLATTAVFEAALLGKTTIAPPGDLAKRSFEQLSHGKYLTESYGGPVSVSGDWFDFYSKLAQPKKFIPRHQFAQWLSPKLDFDTVNKTSIEILSTSTKALSRDLIQTKFSFNNKLLFERLYLTGIHSGIQSKIYGIRKRILYAIRFKKKKLQRFFQAWQVYQN